MRHGMNWGLVILAGVMVWAVGATLNHAQPAGPGAGGTQVAVVDLVRVFNDFEQTKVLNQKMADYRTKVKQDGEKKMQQIKTEQATLDALDPNSADYYKRSQQLKRMQLEYRVWEALEQDLIAENYVRWVKQTYQMVTDEIASVAGARGVQLVVTQEQMDIDVTDAKVLLQQILNRKVVYSDRSVDISGEVLVNLNTAFEKAGGPSSVQFAR